MVLHVGEPKEIKPACCPCCGTECRIAYGTAKDLKVLERGPQPGSTGVCGYCLNWLMFDGKNFLELTEKQIAALTNDEFQLLSLMSHASKTAHEMIRKLEKGGK